MDSVRYALERCRQLDHVIQSLPGILAPSSKQQSPLLLDWAVRDDELYRVVSKLFSDGHYARAVEEGFKFLNNLIKDLAEVTPPKDGADLMRNVFSPKKPVLKLNACSTDSELNEQSGYMEIMAGCMTGIRNPRAHDHKWEDPQEVCLQLLNLANHLVERTRAAARA